MWWKQCCAHLPKHTLYLDCICNCKKISQSIMFIFLFMWILFLSKRKPFAGCGRLNIIWHIKIIWTVYIHGRDPYSLQCIMAESEQVWVIQGIKIWTLWLWCGFLETRRGKRQCFQGGTGHEEESWRLVLICLSFDRPASPKKSDY